MGRNWEKSIILQSDHFTVLTSGPCIDQDITNIVSYWSPHCRDNITLPVVFGTESNSHQCPWWNWSELSPGWSVFPVLCDLWPQPEPWLTQHGWHGDGSYVRAAFQLYKCLFLEGSLLFFFISHTWRLCDSFTSFSFKWFAAVCHLVWPTSCWISGALQSSHNVLRQCLTPNNTRDSMGK